ncbi:MAG: guanylate kinase [Verrucomicrobiota bacterium]
MIETPTDDFALFMIIAGPAGSGKSTLCERLIHEYSSIERVVTCTTRDPRPGEVDGKDYYFFSKEEFEKKVEEDAFLEWAKVHDNFYGNLKSIVQAKLEDHIDLVMNIDVQGVLNYKKAAESNALIKQRLVTVFVTPPSFDNLRQRLRLRGDADSDIDRRLQTAEAEVRQWKEFDYAFVSQSKDQDFEVIKSILLAEKRKVRRMG